MRAPYHSIGYGDAVLGVPGERTSIRRRKRALKSYLGRDGVLFGSEDVEAGERIEPPFKIRGWDPLAVDDEDEDE